MNMFGAVMVAAMLLGGFQATAQVSKKAVASTPVIPPKPNSPPLAASRKLPIPSLTTSQQQQLQSMIASHNRVRSQLSAPDREDLEKLIPSIRKELLAAPLRGPLMGLAMQVVNRRVPGLTASELEPLAEYMLGGIAAASQGGSQADLQFATEQMQETQMNFNLQYLQLQSQMQHENRSYTAISNIMKTKHDTVKNSIGNIR